MPASAPNKELVLDECTGMALSGVGEPVNIQDTALVSVQINFVNWLLQLARLASVNVELVFKHCPRVSPPFGWVPMQFWFQIPHRRLEVTLQTISIHLS